MTLSSADALAVLYVGDDGSADAVADGLERVDGRFDVETATTAGDALRRLSETAVDCLVSEYDLPDSDGLALLEAVRGDADHDGLPVVLYTDAGSESVASEAIRAGVSDYLPKADADIDRLAERVAAAVESRRSRARFESNERRLSLFFEQSSLGVIEWDSEARLVRLNDAAEDILGYTEAELQGEPWGTLVPDDNQEAVADVMERLVANDGGSHSVNENIRKDGERIVCEWHNRVVTDDDGEVIALFSQFRDVTEQHRQRELLEGRERVLKEMYELISAREKSFTEQVEALLALGRDVLGVSYGTLSKVCGDEYLFEVVDAAPDAEFQLEAGDTIPLSMTNCEVAVSTEQTLVLGDIERDAPELLERGGNAEWGIGCYLGAPVFVDGDVYGTFCFYDTDTHAEQFTEWEVTLVDLMSGWVGYELQRREANQRLKRQNERLEEFASLVSHDLRNPLNVAQGRLELGREECDNDHLAVVERAHGRMQTLIEDMLLLARVGRGVDEVSPVALAELVRDCWQGVATGDATLVVDTVRTVRADETRLRQLLENLLRNSVEHGSTSSRTESGDSVEHGGEYVTVTVGTFADGFYVADDGPGIPAESREQVFDSGYTTKSDGTGFGLAIVREIADDHGWAIQITESEAGGARFEFTGVEFEDNE
ncbi:PAS domain S-box-containing protein [Halogranum gelatinilyticum]|uniref:histidine kinase n=1 Tax=Halogranum gelatinilyticum TaxID=660521 RepID=A0A1G9VRH2_9EURY|nr:PAS domain S-box protein [Halogranum gelatinilyticum]SDM74779.1 PAS domain S-box-containing protein [Halogranum gelatinilyticum]